MSAVPTTPQERQQALSAMLDELESRLAALLTSLNPWAADFGQAAWAGIAQLSDPLWPRLRALMPQRDDRFLLQQAWAACFSARIHIGLLYRAGLAQPATQSEAVRLRELTLRRWAAGPRAEGDPRHRTLVNFLMAASPQEAAVPDLGRHTGYRGSIRLRYRMAHVYGQGAGLAAVLGVAASQPAASSFQRRVELARALRAAAQDGRQWRRIGEHEFALLPHPSQELLHQLPELWPQTLAQGLLQHQAVAQRLTELMRESDRIEGVMVSLMMDIRGRRLAGVEALLGRIPDTPVARALGRRLRNEPWALHSMHEHESTHEAFGPWQTLPAACLARLQEWAPQPLPAWWAMPPSEVARRIMAGEFDQPPGSRQVPIVVQDLAPIRRGWTQAQQEALIRSGYGRLLHSGAVGWSTLDLRTFARSVQDLHYNGVSLMARRLQALSDARPYLAMMAAAPDAQEAMTLRQLAQTAIDMHWRHRWDYGWGRWIATAYGCPGWERIEDLALAQTRPLREAVAVFAAGKQPLVPGAFQAVVARSLHTPELLPTRPLTFLKAWLMRDPLAARALVTHAPQEWVERLARNSGTPLQTLDVFMASPSLPLALRQHAWRNRLARTRDAGELAQLSALMPPGLGPFRNLSQWLPQQPLANRAMGLVLVGRRDGTRLQQLHEQLGQEAFDQACTGAMAQLRHTAAQAALEPAEQRRMAHDAAVLELVRALGGQNAANLLKCLARCDHRAPSGGKLDAAYAQRAIPKRGGGERMIHAPPPALKSVQRAILERLLAPLGCHEAACGFVAGRSIVDNARPHVGRTVVANADIRHCFPSVRWPLVLAALRRDLGARLGQQAISLLADLCTAQGALPVGAPTSPALLNRVLCRTDDVLHRNAQRLGARYTRYADDLTFSGGSEAVGLIKLAERTLARIGLMLDPRKTNVFRRGRRQMVTGLVVNDEVGVPRAARRRLRAAVHRVECGRVPHWQGRPQEVAALQGRLGFVAMVNPAQAAALCARLRSALQLRPATDRAARPELAAQSAVAPPAEKTAKVRP